jgi:hypothetical protein
MCCKSSFILANNTTSSTNINSEIMSGFFSQFPRQKHFILFFHALIISLINIKNNKGLRIDLLSFSLINAIELSTS